MEVIFATEIPSFEGLVAGRLKSFQAPKFGNNVFCGVDELGVLTSGKLGTIMGFCFR